MMFLEKFGRHGFLWMMRRFLRELISPATNWGKVFLPFSKFIYGLIHLPLGHFNIWIRQISLKNSKDLYFFYDLEVEPITYDFAWALSIADAERQKLGLHGLKIIIVPGLKQGLRLESEIYEKIIDESARFWRISSILIPLTKLIRTPNSLNLCMNRLEALQYEKLAKHKYPNFYTSVIPVPHSPELAIKKYAKSFLNFHAEIQSLKYLKIWKEKNVGDKKLIVITLREYDYIPERNSQTFEWIKFANSLDPNKYFVVFVPDTEQAFNEHYIENFKNFYVFRDACFNLLLRAALYETAYLNLSVNTGPMSLCWLNKKCRYLIFKSIVKNVPLAPENVMYERGFIYGENPSFCTDFQKWVWDEDSFFIIKQEFDQMIKKIEIIEV